MNELRRYLICLTGIVQGVGFRPFVYRTATYFDLKGWVNNQGSMVVIDVEGGKKQIKYFLNTILKNPPALARIDKIRIYIQKAQGCADFSIINSAYSNNTARFILTDIAVCEKCIEDLNNDQSGRFRYAFTNCTDCGPRYSIIKQLPYDRENTTMSVFEMCNCCKEEYIATNDRRYHAQTNCCSVCGPRLDLLDGDGLSLKCEEPVKAAIELLKQGKVIAIKGIGGYHLCCNALDAKAVNSLRLRKRRPHRPLAVMAKDQWAAQKVCCLSMKENAILSGIQRPIVLLNKSQVEHLPKCIAPNQKRIGIMLPYTPLHHLLFADGLEYIVMTSGNLSGRPICYKDTDVVQMLKGVADYYLVHNREINTPVDDSVIKIVHKSEMVSRCSRGYAPEAFIMDTEHDLLALGAEQKNSICITQNGYANISQYIGDLKDYDTYKVFCGVVENFKSLFKVNPKIYVHDLNPDYLSSRYADLQKGTKIAVQHHHAHMAGCMAEHGLKQDVIGVIFDGTGLGTDGAVWGGEFLTGSRSRFKRAGHLKYVTLQGGDRLIKEPWRSAACYLFAMGIDPREILQGVDFCTIDIIQKALEKGINCCQASSMGRLFDSVAALTGLRTEITYDAQAAIELENQIDESVSEHYSFRITESRVGVILEYEDMLMDLLEDLRAHIAVPSIAAKFHNTIVRASTECICRIRQKSGLNEVILSGGTFENIYLLEGMIKSLNQFGFKTYHNRRIPINDGGISFGQAAVVGQLLKEGLYVSGNPC